MTAQAGSTATPDPAAERAAAIAEFERRDKWRRRLPLLPALLFTIVVTQIPFIFNIWFSLQDWRIVPPVGPDFTGITNYTEGYTNQFFLNDGYLLSLLTKFQWKVAKDFYYSCF